VTVTEIFAGCTLLQVFCSGACIKQLHPGGPWRAGVRMCLLFEGRLSQCFRRKSQELKTTAHFNLHLAGRDASDRQVRILHWEPLQDHQAWMKAGACRSIRQAINWDWEYKHPVSSSWKTVVSRLTLGDSGTCQVFAWASLSLACISTTSHLPLPS